MDVANVCLCNFTLSSPFLLHKASSDRILFICQCSLIRILSDWLVPAFLTWPCVSLLHTVLCGLCAWTLSRHAYLHALEEQLRVVPIILSPVRARTLQASLAIRLSFMSKSGLLAVWDFMCQLIRQMPRAAASGLGWWLLPVFWTAPVPFPAR